MSPTVDLRDLSRHASHCMNHDDIVMHGHGTPLSAWALTRPAVLVPAGRGGRRAGPRAPRRACAAEPAEPTAQGAGDRAGAVAVRPHRSRHGADVSGPRAGPCGAGAGTGPHRRRSGRAWPGADCPRGGRQRAAVAGAARAGGAARHGRGARIGSARLRRRGERPARPPHRPGAAVRARPREP